ncbi:MAG: site-specific integrase [Candidatus Sulfotelmatobacter sp.]|jgi:integrase/recombinase XerD
MLVRYFRRPSRIAQLRSGTGGHLLEGFAKELSQGSYQWVAARKHIRAAEHFLHWIARRNLSIASVEERYAPQFLDHLKRCCCRGHHPPLKPQRQKYSVDLWFVYLRRAGIVPTPAFVEPAVEAPMLVSFCDWMRRQRGVSDATLSIYRFELRAFIKKLGEEPRMYDARNLRQFVLEKSQQSGWASARKSICAIRMFLRFLISQGKCPASLYASVPSFVHWRLSALPRYLQPDQVEKIIATADPKAPLGSRNRAILLLLARLGLRAGDIVRLRFSDVDWKEGMIRVSGKGRRETVLPLSQEVGDALAAYIKDHRPQADTDAMFVRSCAPYRAFSGSTSISIIVARAMRRAGINCPKPGAAHVLRHSVASSMLRGGVSLQEIAAVLRHRSLLTTEIYAKVDVVTLRQIAQPWPEVETC